MFFLRNNEIVLKNILASFENVMLKKKVLILTDNNNEHRKEYFSFFLVF